MVCSMPTAGRPSIVGAGAWRQPSYKELVRTLAMAIKAPDIPPRGCCAPHPLLVWQLNPAYLQVLGSSLTRVASIVSLTSSAGGGKVLHAQPNDALPMPPNLRSVASCPRTVGPLVLRCAMLVAMRKPLEEG